MGLASLDFEGDGGDGPGAGDGPGKTLNSGPVNAPCASDV